MPLLFAVGQHPALVARQERLQANEWILHSSTTSTFSPSGREWALSMLSCRRNCSGMPTFGSMAGKHTSEMPPVLSHPFVKPSDPSARVWRGSDIPTHCQGIRVLGAPVGALTTARQWKQRTYVRAPPPVSTRCPGHRNWWTLVVGNPWFLACTRPGPRWVRAATPTQESGTSMADAVVVHPFVLLLELWLCYWWTLGEGLGLMVPTLPRTKWRPSRLSRASREQAFAGLV